MENISEFLNMGGYGGYIWPAYGASAVVLLALLVASITGLKADEKTLEALQAQGGGRRRRRRANPENLKKQTEENRPEQNGENGDQA